MRRPEAPEIPAGRVYFLHSGGTAQSAAGNGRLSVTRPGRQSSDVLYHDPYSPVPELPATADRRPVELREDVLCWTSSPLGDAVPAVGARAVLHLRSSVAEGRLLAVLVDVHPDGRAVAVATAVLRSTGPAVEREVRVLLDGGDGAVFAPGHRVRLELSGLGRPSYGSGAAPLDAPAVYRVRHDEARASRLVLPSG